MKEKRLDCLTSLRFFACLFVILFHFDQSLLAPIPIASSLVKLGYLGVSFFFTLSGFVLVAVYAPRSNQGHIDRRSFFVARVARIFPLYYLAIVASLVIDLKFRPGSISSTAELLRAFFLRITFLSAWTPGYALKLNSPAWSLGVEGLFYGLFPMLLPWLMRQKGNLGWWAAIMGTLASCALLFAVDIVGGHQPTESFLRYFPPMHLGSFLLGCQVGLLYLNREKREQIAGGGQLALLTLSLLSLGVILVFPDLIPGSLLHNGICSFPFAVIILWVAENESRLTPLRWPPLVLLGEASFAAYILQEPAFQFYAYVVSKFSKAYVQGAPYLLMGYLVAIWALSICSYLWYETRTRKLVRERFESFHQHRRTPKSYAVETEG